MQYALFISQEPPGATTWDVNLGKLLLLAKQGVRVLIIAVQRNKNELLTAGLWCL